MRVRALDQSGDFTFGKGRNDYLSGREALAQSIKTRILCFLGDCFFDVRAGIEWFHLLGGKDIEAIRIALASRILNTEGVTEITELDVERDSSTRALSISYSVNTVYTSMENPDGTISLETDFLLTEQGGLLLTEGVGGILLE